jgi:hypothetical protein
MVFSSYVNIILENEYKCPIIAIERTRGDVSPLEGKMKGRSKGVTNNP